MQSVLLPRYHPLDIFRFACERQAAGERIILVVIEAVSGASVRPIGTPTYGPGSPYMDIQLPCGGGVSVVIIPQPNAEIIAEIFMRLDARDTVGLSLKAGLDYGRDLNYAPPLRVLAAGRGENLLMFARGAQSLSIECLSYSPDANDLEKILGLGGQAQQLSFGAAPSWDIDDRTAIVTLFHDHDYELPLLISALQSPAFYIGAMGSTATHNKRLMALKGKGLDLPRLRGKSRISILPYCVLINSSAERSLRAAFVA